MKDISLNKVSFLGPSFCEDARNRDARLKNAQANAIIGAKLVKKKA
jgi:hypothetical protein